MKKIFLITLPLLNGERLCQISISQLVIEENYLLEEAVDLMLGQNFDFDIVDQNVFEHITTVFAENEEEAYEIYKQKHIERKDNSPYFFKEQLNFIELA